jgi:hypothetical protein
MHLVALSLEGHTHTHTHTHTQSALFLTADHKLSINERPRDEAPHFSPCLFADGSFPAYDGSSNSELED